MKLTATLLLSLLGSVVGHGVLTKVVINGQSACAKNTNDVTCARGTLRPREVISRSGNTGQCALSPGCEAGFICDHCGLEKVPTDLARKAGPDRWWSGTPALYFDEERMWPKFPCMSKEGFGAGGQMKVKPGDTVNTAVYINADHSGIYRFELTCGREAQNAMFVKNPITPWKILHPSKELSGGQPPIANREIGYTMEDVINYFRKTQCSGGGCTYRMNRGISPADQGNCRSDRKECFVEDTFTIPASFSCSGAAILRWSWLSAEGGEVYANCMDLDVTGAGVPPPPADACANVNCGNNGRCGAGRCTCMGGFSGDRCQTAPGISCNINCAARNRGSCVSNDVCGACKAGFSSGAEANAMCTMACPSNCNALKRQPCTTTQQCGVCAAGFVEPGSRSKSEACEPSRVPPPPPAGGNGGGGSFTIRNQWEGGYCGNFKVKCPADKRVSFSMPGALTQAWNYDGASKSGNTVSGTCPPWASEGTEYEGGVCGSKEGRDIVVATSAGFATSGARSFSANDMFIKKSGDVQQVGVNLALRKNQTTDVIPDSGLATAVEELTAFLGGNIPVAFTGRQEGSTSLVTVLTFVLSPATPADFKKVITMDWALASVLDMGVAVSETKATPLAGENAIEMLAPGEVPGEDKPAAPLGAIIGGSVAGVVVLAGVAFLVMKQSQKRDGPSQV